MLKLRTFIVGFLVGVVLSSCISVFAVSKYEVSKNQFPIFINNNEEQLESYNINGYSYFKLRDIGSKVGFDVDFKDNTIIITTTQNGGEEKMNGGYALNNSSRFLKDLEGQVIEVNSVKYVTPLLTSAVQYYMIHGYTIQQKNMTSEKDQFCIAVFSDGKQVTNWVESVIIDNEFYFTYDDFMTYFYPYLDIE